MKRLDFYLIKEMVVPFLIGTIAVVLMFQANTLIYLMKTFSLQNVPLGAIAQYIAYKTPGFLNMTLPVGMALASSLAISRLARESELTAMRSAGVPILRVVLPILVIGGIVAWANFLVVERLIPPGERAARRLAQDVGVLASVPDFRSNVVVNLSNYTVNVGNVARQGEKLFLSRVVLIERPRADEVWLYQAESGVYEAGRWRLSKPFLFVLRGENLLTAKPADDIVIDEPISIPDQFQETAVEEKTAEELRASIVQARRTGQPAERMEVLYHVKYSVPVSCLVFALTGPVFAVAFARSGAFVGVLLSIALVMLYYNAFVISTEILGRNGWVSPWLAAWLPNLLFFALALVAMRRLE
jgi:lipopolysaccharide export system permease protein